MGDMRFIGRGWQYTVYSIGNGKVLKKYNTRLQAYTIMLRQNFPYISYPIWKFPKYHSTCKANALNSIGKIKETKLDLALFGNPKIINELDYEQDEVVPLHVYFKGLSLEAGKSVIDKFVRFNLFLSQNRLIDKSFLIGKNYAINTKGEVILIDIGELYSTDESIAKQIALKPWDHEYVTSTIPAKFREYFVRQMNTHFELTGTSNILPCPIK